MQNLKHLALALLLATLAITTAFASPSQLGKSCKNSEQQGTRLEHLKERLGLTAEQEKEIKEIIAMTREEKETLREAKRSTREELREVSRADTLDEDRLRELLRKQSEQKAEMMIAQHATRSRINQILTPAQRQQQEDFRQQRQEHRGSGKHRQEGQ